LLFFSFLAPVSEAMGYCLKNKNYKFLIIQGDSYSIIQTLTGGRFQPLELLQKCQGSKVEIAEDKAG
jgi:hypothetical protein